MINVQLGTNIVSINYSSKCICPQDNSLTFHSDRFSATEDKLITWVELAFDETKLRWTIDTEIKTIFCFSAIVQTCWCTRDQRWSYGRRTNDTFVVTPAVRRAGTPVTFRFCAFDTERKRTGVDEFGDLAD